MRSLFAATLAGLTVAAAAVADDPKPETKKAEAPAKAAPKKKAEPTLKAGDKAPALKADKWLQGDEVKSFEAGKVYVVEFWQTWCGPCIVMMPHLADLAEEYKAKGVTVVGYAGVMGGDTPEKVKAFVDKRGPKLGYTFANSADSKTSDAWMNAAGRNGIPCCFVVGKDSTVQYIGHPMYLDVVLPKVVAGTWDVAKDGETLADAEKDVSGMFRSLGGAADPEEGLKKYADFVAKWPALADIPYFNGPRLGLLVKAKKTDAAKAMAEGLIAKAGKRGDTIALSTVASSLAAVKDQSELTALALKAADTNLKMAGDTDVNALMTARTTYAAAGQKDKAKEFADKAIAAAEKDLKGDDLNGLMRLVSLCRAAGEADKAKEYAAKAVGAAEKGVKGDDDWQGNLRLASVAKQAGQDDKAKAAAQKAYDNAPEQMKARLVQTVRQYGVEVKKDDK